MKLGYAARWLFLFCLLPWWAFGQQQLVLNPIPGRAVGHLQLTLSTLAPNLVEGKELSRPQSVAVDVSANPPILYISDTGNHRVLVYKDATQASAGAFADIVIGQQDRMSTLILGPGTIMSTGLNNPTGVAVDSAGRLYVVDTGNNRILRYPKPLEQPNPVDVVIGQPSLLTRNANLGGLSEKTISTNPNNAGECTICQQTSLFYDSRDNKLWFTDAGNHRVLRYDVATLSNGAPAELVLGQTDFITGTPLTLTAQNRLVKDRMNAPASLTLDGRGNLFVADSLNRVLVFAPPFRNGQAAARIMGLVVVPQGQSVPPVNDTGFNGGLGNVSVGVFAIGNIPFVVDSLACRILRFDPLDQWPAESATLISPPAKAAIGQDIFTSNSLQINRGKPEASAVSFSVPSNAVFARGEVYLADSGNNRVLVLPDLSSGPQLTTGPPYEARRVVGQLGFEFFSVNLIEGREFNGPSDVVVDTNSNPPHLYVADTANHRVLGFRDARRVRPGDFADVVIGQPDFRHAVPNWPQGLATSVTDSNLNGPRALAVDADGNLWVADTGNGRVMRFPKPFEQTQQRSDLVIGKPNFTAPPSPDPSATNLAGPSGLIFTGEGHLLVSDVIHNRVLFFRKPFTSGMAATNVLGQPALANGDPNFTAFAAGTDLSRFNSPRHIAIDPDDRLYVADSRNNRVLIFDRVTVARAGDPARYSLENSVGSARLTSPIGVTVSQVTGEIWVTDVFNNRLLRYPRFQDLSPLQPNSADPQNILPAPQPLANSFDAFGNLFVADSANRVAIFFPAFRAVNGAHFGRARCPTPQLIDTSGQRLAPGMAATLFSLGANFSTESKAFDTVPLPTTLADTQVLLNDQPVPLYYVSPKQINFQVPWNAPEAGTLELRVERPSVGQILAVGCTAVQTAGCGTATADDDRFACLELVRADSASPAVFTFGGGTGQVAALNPDGSVNSPSNPISRGQVLQVFGTGQGRVPNAPADGAPSTGLVPTIDPAEVLIGTGFVPPENVTYSGLAPDLIGVWQINVKIPDTVAPGGAVPFVVRYRSRLSNLQNAQSPQNPNGISTTIAVKQ